MRERDADTIVVAKSWLARFGRPHGAGVKIEAQLAGLPRGYWPARIRVVDSFGDSLEFTALSIGETGERLYGHPLDTFHVLVCDARGQ